METQPNLYEVTGWKEDDAVVKRIHKDQPLDVTLWSLPQRMKRNRIERRKNRRERMPKHIIKREVTEEEMSEITSVLNKKVRTEDAVPDDWELVEKHSLPPILLKPALNVLTSKWGNSLYLSDIDPFLSDYLVDVETHSLYDEYLNKLGEDFANVSRFTQENGTLSFAKTIAEYCWNKNLDVNEAIALQHSILTKYGKPPYFPVRLPYIPCWFLAIVETKHLPEGDSRLVHLVPITDEEAASPEWWEKIAYAHFVSKIPVRKQYEPFVRLLRMGLLFHKFKTPEGKAIYVLSKDRYRIENDADLIQYLSYVTCIYRNPLAPTANADIYAEHNADVDAEIIE